VAVARAARLEPVQPAAWPRWRLTSAPGARRVATGLGLASASLFFVFAAIADDWSDLLPGLLAFVLCWGLLWGFVVLHRLPTEDKAWLLGLCGTAFALRVVVALTILSGPWDYRLFGEDQLGYDYVPAVVATSWSSDSPAYFYQQNPMLGARKGYINFVALQYYLFGQSLIVPRIFNCLAGALVVFYSVALTGRLFGKVEGRIAGVWTALFPAMVLWSSLNLRDIWLALSVLVIVYHAFVLRDRFSPASLMVIVANLVWIHFNREYLVFITIVACVAIFVFARSTSRFRDVVVALLLAVILLGLYQSLGLGKEGLEWLDLDRLAEQREKLARASVGRSGYLGDIDITSPAALVAAFPLLLAYFLFSPFPWQMTVARRLVLAPEMVFWYWLTPLVFIAFRHVLRERATRQFALLMTLAVVTVAFAVPSANMGLAYRYRVQIVPLYLAFAAAGYVRRRAPALAGHDAHR
jgi:hypothetical protein